MRSTHLLPAAILFLSLMALIALPYLTGCATQSPSEGTTPPTETDTTAENADRAYYESLIASLKQELLEAKQAAYITEHEYESRIAALEAELALLEAGAELGSDLPVSGTPSDGTADSLSPDRNSPETTADPDRPASMAFRYGIEEGQAVIYEYLGTEPDVTVPSVIEGYPVTRIADRAFEGTAVTSVVIPQSVTDVGWFAFYGCSSLESVTLPTSVARIAYAAFDNCPHLTLYCFADTYAAEYAVSFGLKHEYI